MPDNRGMGARAIAMGGAYTGVANDAFATYYNPAGLLQMDGHHIDAEYMMVFPKVSLETGTGPAHTYLDKEIKTPLFGIVIDLSRDWTFNRKVRVGLALGVPDNMKGFAKIRYGKFYDPYYPLYGDSSVEQMIQVYGCGAIDIFPWLYVGGGCNLSFDSPSLTLGLVADPVTLNISSEYSRVNVTLSTETAGIIGVMVKPAPKLRIGFTMRSATSVYVSGGVVLDPKILLDGQTYPLDIIPLLPVKIPLNAHYRPKQYATGVSYQLLDNLLLAYDLVYNDWRNYRDEANQALNPGMKEVFIHRFGLEFCPFKDLALRAGYGYEPSPLKQQYATWINYLDNDIHEFSCGMGYTFSLFKNLTGISLYYQYAYMVPRTFQSVHDGEYLRSSGNFHSFGIGMVLNF